jgi:ribosomal RNA-processing protein 1
VCSSTSSTNNSPNDPKIPNSIRYHITDIYLDELDKIQSLESTDVEFSATIDLLIVPFKTLQKEGRDKTAKTKAKDLLEDSRLQEADSDDDSE